jgi:hypothetical protein
MLEETGQYVELYPGSGGVLALNTMTTGVLAGQELCVTQLGVVPRVAGEAWLTGKLKAVWLRLLGRTAVEEGRAQLNRDVQAGFYGPLVLPAEVVAEAQAAGAASLDEVDELATGFSVVRDMEQQLVRSRAQCAQAEETAKAWLREAERLRTACQALSADVDAATAAAQQERSRRAPELEREQAAVSARLQAAEARAATGARPNMGQHCAASFASIAAAAAAALQ